MASEVRHALGISDLVFEVGLKCTAEIREVGSGVRRFHGGDSVTYRCIPPRLSALFTSLQAAAPEQALPDLANEVPPDLSP